MKSKYSLALSTLVVMVGFFILACSDFSELIRISGFELFLVGGACWVVIVRTSKFNGGEVASLIVVGLGFFIFLLPEMGGGKTEVFLEIESLKSLVLVEYLKDIDKIEGFVPAGLQACGFLGMVGGIIAFFIKEKRK